MRIEDWLYGIGLAQYAELFRSNDIDAEVMRGLTDDDLKEIGVTSLGHRKKLLDAIASFDAGLGAPISARAMPPRQISAAPSRSRMNRTPDTADLIEAKALLDQLQ